LAPIIGGHRFQTPLIFCTPVFLPGFLELALECLDHVALGLAFSRGGRWLFSLPVHNWIAELFGFFSGGRRVKLFNPALRGFPLSIVCFTSFFFFLESFVDRPSRDRPRFHPKESGLSCHMSWFFSSSPSPVEAVTFATFLFFFSCRGPTVLSPGFLPFLSLPCWHCVSCDSYAIPCTVELSCSSGIIVYPRQFLDISFLRENPENCRCPSHATKALSAVLFFLSSHAHPMWRLCVIFGTPVVPPSTFFLHSVSPVTEVSSFGDSLLLNHFPLSEALPPSFFFLGLFLSATQPVTFSFFRSCVESS